MTTQPQPMDPSVQERNHAEAAKLLAEQGHLNAQAAEAWARARIAQLELDDAERSASRAAAADERNHTYQFSGGVAPLSASSCRAVLARWHRQDATADWTIVFTSPGGDVISGMALFDDLVAYSKRGGGSHKITTVVRGYAASMGGILLQAGDVRVCGPESYILIHEIAAGTGGKIGEIEDDVKFYRLICKRVESLFVQRSGGKLSLRTLRHNWQRKDWWLDSAAALKYGIVDEVR